MMSISFPSGPNALSLELSRGRWWTGDVDLCVEVAAADGKLLHPGLAGADAGRTNPSTHDTAASRVGKHRRAQGVMLPSHHRHVCVRGGNTCPEGGGEIIEGCANMYGTPCPPITTTSLPPPPRDHSALLPGITHDDPPVDEHLPGQPSLSTFVQPPSTHYIAKTTVVPHKDHIRVLCTRCSGLRPQALSHLCPCLANACGYRDAQERLVSDRRGQGRWGAY